MKQQTVVQAALGLATSGSRGDGTQMICECQTIYGEIDHVNEIYANTFAQFPIEKNNKKGAKHFLIFRQ